MQKKAKQVEDLIKEASSRETALKKRNEELKSAKEELLKGVKARDAWLPDGYSQIFRSYLFGPSSFWTMAPLRYAAKFDPFLSLDCAPTPSTLAQSKERKGSNFAIWQPGFHAFLF